MKKLLIGTAAIALGFAASAPAQAADGVKLGLGGSFAGYVTWLDQDELTGTEVRSFDIQRETEVTMHGETTLDNGLTVGVHFEMEADGGAATNAADDFAIEESYAYFSGAWGRVNFGSEDGAAFLLQVAAPSADTNIDGLRQQVQPVNYLNTALGTAGAIADGLGTAAGNINYRFDYDNNPARFDNKLTYMTPVFNGFQAGASYTPDTGCSGQASLTGNCTDNTADYGSVWELAARYEGKFNDVGITLGGGYTNTDREAASATLDDRTRWDAGLNLKWGAFNLGGAYLKDDHGWDLDADETVWVAGIDYTVGAYKIGLSYMNNEQETEAYVTNANGGVNPIVGGGKSDTLDTDRWTAGVQYTYGPGMTFRGSVSLVDHELNNDYEAAAVGPPAQLGLTDRAVDDSHTFVMLGTQINF